MMTIIQTTDDVKKQGTVTKLEKAAIRERLRTTIHDYIFVLSVSYIKHDMNSNEV